MYKDEVTYRSKGELFITRRVHEKKKKKEGRCRMQMGNGRVEVEVN